MKRKESREREKKQQKKETKDTKKIEESRASKNSQVQKASQIFPIASPHSRPISPHAFSASPPLAAQWPKAQMKGEFG